MRRRLHLPRIATTLLLITLIMYPAAAQEGYPLPESLPPLTPDNAAQIQPLAAIGGILPGGLAWSPDDRWLAVGTSNGVQVYDSLDWNAPPRLIDADRNVSFNAAGELLSGGERRNIATGESLGAASPPVLPPRHPEVQITRDDASGETVVILQRDDGTSATLPLGGSYYFGGVVYSPDKSLAALTLFYDVDNNQLLDIQLWDMVHETRLGDLPQSLEIPLLVTFHADGKLLVIATTTDAEYGGPFEQVSVWDVQAGEYVGPYGYLPAVISPDGEILAFMTGAGVALWTDHEVGILKYDYAYDETGHPEILFSSDSRTLITPSGSKVLLWNVSTETVPDAPRQIITAAAPISRLQQNPSASLLVAEEGGRTLEVWDAKTHERLWSLLDTGSGVQFSPDGQRLRNAGYIDDLMIWDAATGAVRLTAPPQSVLNTQWSQAAYWKDGGVHVVTGASAETVILPVISDYLCGVAAFSPAAEMAFFTGQEIQGYSLKNGERILQQSIIGNVPWVAFNAGGTHFAIRKTGQDNSGVLELWETANLQEPVVQSAVPYHGYGEGTLLSPDGQYLSQIGPACGDGGGGAFYLRDIHTWDKLVNWYPGSDCGPYAQVFGPDGTWIMVGWAAYVAVVDITLLDAQTVPPDRQWLGTVVSAMRYNTSRTEIQDLILSPDGSALAVAVTVDQFENERPVPVEQVDIYRFADILERAASQTDTGATFTIPNAHSAAFSPDERWIWTDAGFWDVQGEQRAGVSGQYAAFNPESTLLATADTENVRLWSVDELANGDETPLLTVPLRDVQQIAFSPDGTRLYIQRSGDVRVWGVPPG